MTSERFVKENRTACVVAGLCYGTEWPTRSFASAAFWSSLRRPNQSVFIAGFSVNLELNITPLQLSTLITCSEPEVEWQEPPDSSLQDFSILVAKHASLKHQVFFCICQVTSGLWAISHAKSRNNCLFLEESASRDKENCWSFTILEWELSHGRSDTVVDVDEMKSVLWARTARHPFFFFISMKKRHMYVFNISQSSPAEVRYRFHT